VKGIAVNDSLDHGRIQEAKLFSRTGYLVSHALHSQSPTTSPQLYRTALRCSVKQTRGNCQEFIGFKRAAASLLVSSFDITRVCIVVVSTCSGCLGGAPERYRIACMHVRIHCRDHADHQHSPVARDVRAVECQLSQELFRSLLDLRVHHPWIGSIETWLCFLSPALKPIRRCPDLSRQCILLLEQSPVVLASDFSIIHW